MKNTVLIILSLLILTGCGTYSRYTRPEVSTDGLYRDLPVTNDTSTIASLPWHEMFTDNRISPVFKSSAVDFELGVKHCKSIITVGNRCNQTCLNSLPVLSGTLGWTNNGGGIVTNPGQWLLNAIGSLTQPLFNRGANVANLKIAKAQQEEARLLFQQSLLDAGKEVNDALTAWQTAKSQIDISERQVETLTEAVRKTQLLMRYSDTTYLEVLTAQQTLLDAEMALAQRRFSVFSGTEIQAYLSL